MRQALLIVLPGLLALGPARAPAQEPDLVRDESPSQSMVAAGNPRLRLVNWANRNLERAAELAADSERTHSATTALAVRALSDNLRRQIRITSPNTVSATTARRQDEGFLRIRSSGLDDGPLNGLQRAALTSRNSPAINQLAAVEPEADPAAEPDTQRIPPGILATLIVVALAAGGLFLRQLRD